MSAYVLRLPEGKLDYIVLDRNFPTRFNRNMHYKDLRQAEKYRVTGWFFLPACVLPWNVSPKKKANKS